MAEEEKKEEEKKPEGEAPKEKWETTRHSFRIGKQTIKTTVHAGVMPVHDKEEKVIGSLFFTAYFKEKEPASKRPLLFAFNGGPGSSSVWLHIGAFGPYIVSTTKEGFSLPPPAQIKENAHSLLPFADLVFIDPISTGFSRAFPLKDAEKYHTVRNDMELVSQFIRRFLTCFQRWSSPKYLAGESYGGTRAAYLAHHLETSEGINLNGLIFISPALNFYSLISENNTNILSYACLLPSLATTAWYHNKAMQKKPISTVAQEAVQFVQNDYLPFLFRGNLASAAERKKINKRMSQLVGLSEAFIDRCHQRLTVQRYTKELLREEFRTIGRLDSRFTGMDRDAGGECYEYDPSYANLQGSYTSAWNDYVTRVLKYESEAPYHILSMDINKTWKWTENPKDMGYLDFSDQLRQTLQYNPHLNVFIANGYFDLATPFFTTDYTVQHVGFESALMDRIKTSWYPSGHMMYITDSCMKALHNDLKAFIC